MPEPTLQIALIGFMGTGKSTIGPLLARELGFEFLDLDVLIAERAGCGIPEIFARRGEEGFRRLEREILAEAAGRPGQVLATGGGVVTDPANAALLRATGLVVWLKASPAAIMARVARGDGRPLLAGGDPVQAVARLLPAREALYRAAADLSVETSGLEPIRIAGEIAAWYQRRLEK